MNDRICIVAGKRTPQGRFLGALAGYSAAMLAQRAALPLLDAVPADCIDLVVLGNVLSAGAGMNVARQVALNIGLPEHVPAFTVNMMCASGMKAVALAAQAIMTGEAEVVLAGGAESMSNAPYLLERARSGYRLGDGTLVDSLLRDGLIDGRIGEHMATTVERLAGQFGIDRQGQDAYAARSHQRYFQALAAGRYTDEIVPVDKTNADEHPRADAAPEKLATLRPAFDPQGTITAGNASGVNDGAAMLILCGEQTARRRGWQPMCALDAWAAVGCQPQMMGLGPVRAVEKLRRQTGCRLADFDHIELNEAFAAQTLACLKELALPANDQRINPDGGAIALGHPIGASGARLIVHLAHCIARGQSRRGLAALCVGGGMGMAVVLEAIR